MGQSRPLHQLMHTTLFIHTIVLKIQKVYNSRIRAGWDMYQSSKDEKQHKSIHSEAY
jgi:hypothetical protein